MDQSRNEVIHVVDINRVQAILSGDQEEFELVVNQYKRYLRTIVSKRVPLEYVEDVLNDTWLSAFRSMPGFQGRSSLMSWLFSIAVRRCCAFWRSRSLSVEMVNVSQDAESDRGFEELAFSASAEHHSAECERSAQRATVKRLLAELSQDDAKLFVMRYVSDLSIEQIADELSWERSRVKVRLFRGRAQLKRAYEAMAARACA